MIVFIEVGFWSDLRPDLPLFMSKMTPKHHAITKQRLRVFLFDLDTSRVEIHNAF